MSLIRVDSARYVCASLPLLMLSVACNDAAEPGVAYFQAEVVAPSKDVLLTPDLPVAVLDTPTDLAVTDIVIVEHPPCVDSDDCPSDGVCIVGKDGSICTVYCQSDCEPGWTCKQIFASGSDPFYACAQNHIPLCRPCRGPADCTDPTGTAARCQSLGAHGSYCVTPCDASTPCPTGFDCAAGAEGTETFCTPTSGECACDGVAVGSAMDTECYVVNDVGQCQGTRGCGGGSLSACDAAVPVAETCNGADDNCDGRTDEEFADCDDDGIADCVDADADADGILEDGDASGTPGDKPCAGGAVANCDDNCPKCKKNSDQADEDGDGVGDACANDDPDGDGFTVAEGDCNNGNALVFPGATEGCNGADDDCDTSTDEADATGCKTYYLDSDGDGHGQKGDSECLCGPAGDYSTKVSDDCDDAHETVFPGATERCDGFDNDCNEVADPPGAQGCVAYYYDGDTDGYGFTESTTCRCGPDGAFSTTVPGDCDDLVSSRHPDATEVCNGEDDDCDTDVDESANAPCTTLCGSGVIACEDGAPGACDAAAEKHCKSPATGCADFVTCGACPVLAGEACNGKDDDCDGDTDEGVLEAFYLDFDGDGVGAGEPSLGCKAPADHVPVPGDCNDFEPAVSPLAAEACNAIDDDCNDQTDEGVLKPFYTDGDFDGHGTPVGPSLACTAPPGTVVLGDDCNDDKPAIFPGADERCNAVDDDCDTETDELWPSLGEACDGEGDTDTCADGKFACNAVGSDVTCQDSADLLVDICNGADDDCDGVTDPENAPGCESWYLDLDVDGYGVGAPRCQCGPVGEFVADEDEDCDDDAKTTYPGAGESCNGVDDDCDGDTDEPGSGGCTVYYTDTDFDGFGTAVSQCLCEPFGAFTAIEDGDCDDTVQSSNPDGTEVCGGADEDCDGATDEQDGIGCTDRYQDGDGDGYGTELSKCLCAPLGAFSAGVPGDCNDSSPLENPGKPEVCNGKDDDCSGLADDGDPGGGLPCTLLGLKSECAKGVGVCTDKKVTCTQVVFPETEICNGADDDCNGTTDDEDAFGCDEYFLDGDNDGFGKIGFSKCLCAATSLYKVLDGGDCNDAVLAINPDAAETCNGKDDNCSNETDEGDLGGADCSVSGKLGACKAGVQMCVSPKLVCTQTVFPTDESCNGADDDCDGFVDEENANGCIVYYTDADNDGYGKDSAFKCLCAPTAVYEVTEPGDCNDLLATINPDEVEACNGKDDDCNSSTDEGNPGSGIACNVTGLLGECKKGLTECSGGKPVCVQTVFAQNETCNGLDDDCNGTTDGMQQTCSNGCYSGTQTCTLGNYGSCNAQQPQCTGVSECCDGCNFRSSSTQCGGPDQTTQSCQGGCGGTIVQQSLYRYCTGSSATCGNGNTKWVSGGTVQQCSSGQACTTSGSSASCTSCACGCSGSQCTTNSQYAKQCSNGDVYWTDCNGQTTSLVEDCGSCSCSGAACQNGDTSQKICSGSNLHYKTCKGGVGSFIQTCCGGCSGGACSGGGSTVIIDNTDGSPQPVLTPTPTSQNSWYSVKNHSDGSADGQFTTGAYGSDAKFAYTFGGYSGSYYGRYTTSAALSGTYTVSVHHPNAEAFDPTLSATTPTNTYTKCTSVAYKVVHDGNTSGETVTRSQATSGWVSLGTFTFCNRQGEVRWDDTATPKNCTLAYDAVRWAPN